MASEQPNQNQVRRLFQLPHPQLSVISRWLPLERRRYPAYEHVAVLIAENITARFLNVLSLMSGSIPFIAIQLEALRVGDQLILDFLRVLDQTELRADDTDEDSGGGQVDRAYWDEKAGKEMMKICDQLLSMVNDVSTEKHDLNYLRGYIGLRANGIVNNIVSMSPKPTKKYTQVWFRNPNSTQWKVRFDESGIPSQSKHSNRFRISVTSSDFSTSRDLIGEAIRDTVESAKGS